MAVLKRHLHLVVLHLLRAHVQLMQHLLADAVFPRLLNQQIADMDFKELCVLLFIYFYLSRSVLHFHLAVERITVSSINLAQL